MAPLRALAPLAALVATAFADPPTCQGGDLEFSCQNSTAVEDTCCFITSGQLVLTQFWDTDPVTGPDDSWTIHGLWPDWCDGTYPASCDSSREYSNITDILESFGATSTLSDMQTFWKDYKGDDETFWEHEWGKHGTCISTLEPDCYTDYESTEEAVHYFARAVELFKSLPTHDWLADAGITPGSETYALSDIQAALDEKHGAAVQLGCDGDILNEAWYTYNVKGSLQDGEFKAVDPTGTGSTDCPDQVSYPSKSGNKSTKARRGIKPQTRPFAPVNPISPASFKGSK